MDTKIRLWSYNTVPGDAEYMAGSHFNSGVVASTEEEIEQIKKDLGDHEGEEVYIRPLTLETIDTLRADIYQALDVFHGAVTLEEMCESDKLFEPVD